MRTAPFEAPPRAAPVGDGLAWGAGCITIASVLVLYLLHSFDFSVVPYEDAAILLHYAENIAGGHGIVWNVGGGPVDGATDFLYMLEVAALQLVGLSPETASHLLGGGAHLLTCGVVYVGLLRLHATPRWMALLATVFLAFGPALRHVEALFGTPVFGLFAATTWYAAYYMYRQGITRRGSAVFSVSALLLALIRPEGVFLAVFFLLSLGVAKGWHAIRSLCVVFVVVFGIPGAIYFFWRWNYFGHPLPNPYYIKGHGSLHWRQANKWVQDMFTVALPCALLFAYGGIVAAHQRFFGSRELEPTARADWKEAVFVLLPFLLFLALSVLHEGLMDYYSRFTYYMLPIALMSWPPFLRMGLRGLGLELARVDLPRTVAGRVLIAFLFSIAVTYQVTRYSTRPPDRWGTYDLARILSEYPNDYTMVVTNAGHLPLYSRWNSIDAWGLNDHEIALHGLSEELLERELPELLQFDAGFTPLTEGWYEIKTPWVKSSRTMKAFAEEHGYVFAAMYANSPYKGHYYYVRPDFPESAEIVRRIREMDYFLGQRKCVDLRDR